MLHYKQNGRKVAYQVNDFNEPRLLHLPTQEIPGVGNVNPLQYSCLENSMDRGAWGRTESDTTEHAHINTGKALNSLT